MDFPVGGYGNSTTIGGIGRTPIRSRTKAVGGRIPLMNRERKGRESSMAESVPRMTKNRPKGAPGSAKKAACGECMSRKGLTA